MNLLTRYRDWRLRRRVATVEATDNKLGELHIERAALLRMEGVVRSTIGRFLIQDMLSGNIRKTLSLERKLERMRS